MIIQATRYGKLSTARLPKEYQEVEYIQSSGTQYIDTGFTPNQDTRVVMDFQSLLSAGGWPLFGSRTNSSSNAFTFGSTSTNNAWVSGYNSSSVNSGVTENANRHIVDKNKNLCYLDGNLIASSTYASFTCPANARIFGFYSTDGHLYAQMRLYSCQMYNNGTLISDFVPCYRKADGVVGLYDLVNDSFYANAGTGTFIKGADVGGSGSSGELFEFTYSGNYTDNRINGKGTVTLNTSGTLTVLSGKATVSVYILGAGGGGVYNSKSLGYSASGGGGGNQTVEVELAPGTYEIVIGTGGAGKYLSVTTAQYAGTGGKTTAFGYTSTGGGGAYNSTTARGGSGGTPNGNAGSTGRTAGGAPNGGSSTSTTASNNNGGDGLVRITFS